MATKSRKWKVLESRIVVDSPYIRVRRERCMLPNGKVAKEYYVIDKKNVAAVFALTPKRQVVLVEEYKHGAGKVVLQLPTGFIEPGEAAVSAARRELAEETGYAAKKFSLVSTMGTSASDHSNKFSVFYATGAYLKGLQSLDETEDIKVRLVPLSALPGLISNGKIDSLAQVASILLTARKHKLF